MIVLYLVSLLTLADGASVLFKDNPLLVKPCNLGQIVENDCNTCVCSHTRVYECFPKSTKECKNTISSNSSSYCLKNTIFVLNDTICICNRNGQWPHSECNKVFKAFETEAKCKPNSYVTKDCNVCRCGSNGILDKDHCTKNKCKPKTINLSKNRRFLQQSNVYGNCEVKNWYSLAPCQFCFCINENKLVCNTGNSYARKLVLGAYNLSVCGQELIREAIALIPENEKSLRYGIEKDNGTNIDTKGLLTRELQIPEGKVAIDENRNGNESKSDLTNNNNNDEYEYYTDSEEKTSPIKIIGREGASTKLPYEEESADVGYERQESEQSPETDNEIGVEIEAQTDKSVTQKMELKVYQQPPAPPEKEPDFNLSKALKLNLPSVLDKVFQMALRKSMVSVDSNTKCTPGAATILKCNVCFCMKENKLMCTNNVCEK